MAGRSNLVNLDAMIEREDFAKSDTPTVSFEKQPSIGLRDLYIGGLMGPILRKPDFQRETNHWTPEQVCSLLECFVSGDLIPSVILWYSTNFVFVIDGGHRLSVLKAWILDDYGDGPTSQQYFGYSISREQKRVADRTRKLIKTNIGTWNHFNTVLDNQSLTPAERSRVNTVASRGLPILWVNGDADKAESSFFKINTQGTPLDSIEEQLLKSRKKPIPIAARAVIRAGKGHKYWSCFDSKAAEAIENTARHLHQHLFDPELECPVKTLDLPLGGSKGVRTALQLLISFMLIAVRNQNGDPKTISDMDVDLDGARTLDVLERSLRLSYRITGNENGSLGLHPAVYFYGPTGHHSEPMFMGTVALFGKHLANNNKQFFANFSKVRSDLEAILIQHKDLIATILQKSISRYRVIKYSVLLESLINTLSEGGRITDAKIVSLAGLDGKIVLGNNETNAIEFSDEVKSAAFISQALNGAIRCPDCNGYLDTRKSVSYDHKHKRRDGGRGSLDNVQLTHPYCNQSKN